MNPNKKVLFSLVSFFLIMVTIACSFGSTIPSGSGTQSISPEGGSTRDTNEPAVPAATETPAQLASPFIEQVASQTEVQAGENGTTIATCPSGSLMLGGGFAAGKGMKIMKTMPDTAGWLVTGLNSTAGALSLNAYAYCLHNSTGITQIITKDVMVSGFPRVSCSNGGIATGGGYAFDSGSLEVYLSTPDGEPSPYAWSVMAQNHQDEDQLLHVYVVCLSNSGLTATLVRDEVTFLPGTDSLNFTIACPDGAALSAGGYEGTGAYISRINSTDAGLWEVNVQGKIYFDASLDHAVCLYLP